MISMLANIACVIAAISIFLYFYCGLFLASAPWLRSTSESAVVPAVSIAVALLLIKCMSPNRSR